MLKELAEVLGSKWGLIGLGALLLVSGGGKKAVRKAAKGVIKAGLAVSDSTREYVAELKEQTSDLIAEAKAEKNESQTHAGINPEPKKSKKKDKEPKTVD
jgi:hypothetical protein